MDFLEITSGCTVVKLRKSSDQGGSLEEQANKYLTQNPFLLFDVSNIEFTSMNIGELVNLIGEFDKIWGSALHRIGLLGLNQTGKTIFDRTGLAEQLPNFDSVSEALTEFTGG